MNVWSILLCAGSGTRMGAEGNKTLLPIGGVPAIVHALKALARHSEGVVLVVRPGEEASFSSLLARHCPVPCRMVNGGATRQKSVQCGLAVLPPACDTVLIHDGARPFPDDSTIQNVLRCTRLHGCGIPACPVTDTLQYADREGRVLSTPSREQLYAVQTPQGFNRKLLEQAFVRAKGEYTAESSLLAAAGESVYLCEGSRHNIKLTTKEDYQMALSAAPTDFRVGHGYDAHRFCDGRPLILGGVHIPWQQGLDGHSDADVLTHAILDALLSAAHLGDIGQHFPDSDPRYKGISSLVLAQQTEHLLAAAGWGIVNIDATVIAQQPKLLPYREAMQQQLAQVFHLRDDQLSLKATTTERMGFEGRMEGISAHAVCLLCRTAPDERRE